MLLATDVQGALDAVRGTGQGSSGVATLVGVAVEHEVLLAQGFDHIQHRLQVFILDDCGHGRTACGVEVAGGHGEYRLAEELDLVDGQQRVAGHHRADVLEAGDVFVGDGDAHALEGIARRGVDAQDARVGAVGGACIDVQLVGEFQAVVDVYRLAGHMLVGAVVLDAAADPGGQVLAEQFGHLGLALGYVMVRHKRSPGSRCTAFAVR
ncbi:hypothetical protein D3C72_1671080 [compost metagenome]